MEKPICLSPLKFYSDIKYQNRYKSFAYGEVSPLIVYANMIPPFQLVVDKNATSVSAVYLYDANTNTKGQNILQEFSDNLLKVTTVEDIKIIQYLGILPIKSLKLEGNQFLEIVTDNGVSYFSEVFASTNNVDDCLFIEYSSPTNLEIKDGIVLFENGFKFNLYLRGELGKPEYKFEEEATKRLGYTFIESQVSKKIYKFNTVIPEYLCDALRIVRLCPNKVLKSNGRVYQMLSFDMDVDWQEQGDLASVTCEFQVDNVIVNLGGYKPNQESGDFNSDYNDDFNLSKK